MKYYQFENRLDICRQVFPDERLKEEDLKIIDSFSQIAELEKDGYEMVSSPVFEDLKAGLEKGAYLFFLFVEKKLAHLSMVIMRYEVAVLFDPIFKKSDSREAGYIGPCYTLPQYRGKGIYPYVLSRICNFSKKKSQPRALINTKISNNFSIKGIEKAGFKVVAEISHSRWFFINFFGRRKVDVV